MILAAAVRRAVHAGVDFLGRLQELDPGAVAPSVLRDGVRSHDPSFELDAQELDAYLMKWRLTNLRLCQALRGQSCKYCVPSSSPGSPLPF